MKSFREYIVEQNTKVMSDSELHSHFEKHKKGLGKKWLNHPAIVDARSDAGDDYFVNHANAFAKKHKVPVKFHGVHHDPDDDDQMHWHVSHS